MKNPNPVNLQTSEEVREKGWQAESRDADGHLISCHAPIEADDPGIAEWIVECTRNGQTVTFWPADASTPAPVAHVSCWACEDKPSGENNPCAICNKSTPAPQTNLPLREQDRLNAEAGAKRISDFLDGAPPENHAAPASPTVDTVACHCTMIEQDESCPVGYPSLLCEECDGKGHIFFRPPADAIKRLRAYASGSNDAKFDTYDAADVLGYLERLSPSPQPNLQGHSAADIVKRIADVSTATGAMAGEPAIELAGQIISVLAVHPEHIDRFMAEGSELFIDGTLNPENGSMTYRANSGAILHPSVLREKNGSQQ